MLERPPVLGQQREATLAQAAGPNAKARCGPGINVQLFDPSRPGMAAARPDILPGRGQSMDIARQRIRNPQRDPRRIKSAWMFPPKSWVFPTYHIWLTSLFCIAVRI